jgi:ATP-binding protein involved in chromosome partitioning
MKKHIIEAIQSHLKSYKVQDQEGPLVPATTQVTLQQEKNTIRIILSDQAHSLARISQHQKSLLDSLKQAFFEYDFQILLHAHHQKTTAKSHASPKIEKFKLPHIKKIIAIASGKGGVGKSLVAVNVALSLKKQGLKVGLLDLDIYGPSVPTMLNLFDEPIKENGMLHTLQYEQMPVLSMGHMIPPEKAVIWRGPLIQKAVQQLLVETAWPSLDVLVLDTPPGTGDVHLSLAQQVPLTGVIVVSTPQKLALIDAQKSIEMFQTLAIPILGLIENMANPACDSCGAQMEIFPDRGMDSLSQKEQIPILERIPLDPNIRQSADHGKPHVLSKNMSNSVIIFQKLGEKISQILF